MDTLNYARPEPRPRRWLAVSVLLAGLLALPPVGRLLPLHALPAGAAAALTGIAVPLVLPALAMVYVAAVAAVSRCGPRWRRERGACLAGAALALAGGAWGLGLVLVASLWAGYQRPLTAADLAGELRHGFGIGMRPEWVLRHGERTGERDPSSWYVFAVPPGQAESLKQAMLDGFNTRPGAWAVDDRDRLSTFPVAGESPPAFWRPETLAEPDVLSAVGRDPRTGQLGGEYYWVVSCRRSGTVYLYHAKS